jgi:hypothetical protein
MEEGKKPQGVPRTGFSGFIVHDDCQSHTKVVENCYSLKINDLIVRNPRTVKMQNMKLWIGRPYIPKNGTSLCAGFNLLIGRKPAKR